MRQIIFDVLSSSSKVGILGKSFKSKAAVTEKLTDISVIGRETRIGEKTVDFGGRIGIERSDATMFDFNQSDRLDEATVGARNKRIKDEKSNGLFFDERIEEGLPEKLNFGIALIGSYFGRNIIGESRKPFRIKVRIRGETLLGGRKESESFLVLPASIGELLPELERFRG